MPSKKGAIVISDRLAQQRLQARRVEARYDAAQTTVENRRHWAFSDNLSARAAHTPAVLRTLRNRSRYEVANNSYARGLVDTISDYVVGTGPRLQMLTDSDDINTIIEEEWADWTAAVSFSQKLRTMRIAKSESGEVFGLLATNPILEGPIKLDIQVIEADQCSSPYMGFDLFNQMVDGIDFDTFGNPKSYTILDRHPGDMRYLPQEYSIIPAQYVVHLFTPLRPGQARGVPELTPALPLFALLRRYTLAVLNAAEQAALITGMIHTDAPANGDDAADVDQFDPVTLDRGTFLTLPEGWKASQMKAEQPTTVYSDFKREVLNEIARCLKIPFNIAAGNSSSYNYASGRLDHQAFFRFLEISRDEMVSQVLEKVFKAWFFELTRNNPLFVELRNGKMPIHTWFWDGFEHVDPAKEANAQETRLLNNTTTLADEYAKQGFDWRIKLRQRGAEIKMMKELGIPVTDPGQNSTAQTIQDVANEE